MSIDQLQTALTCVTRIKKYRYPDGEYSHGYNLHMLFGNHQVKVFIGLGNSAAEAKESAIEKALEAVQEYVSF